MDLEKLEKLQFSVSVCQVNRLLLLAHECSPVRQSIRCATPAATQVVHSIDIRKYHSFTPPGLRGGWPILKNCSRGWAGQFFFYLRGPGPPRGAQFLREVGWQFRRNFVQIDTDFSKLSAAWGTYLVLLRPN